MSKTIFPEPASCETCYFITDFDEKDTYISTQSVAIGVMSKKYVSILTSYIIKKVKENEVPSSGFVHLLLNKQEIDDMIRGLQEAKIRLDTITDKEIKKLKGRE
jgi:hypothetical protein